MSKEMPPASPNSPDWGAKPLPQSQNAYNNGKALVLVGVVLTLIAQALAMFAYFDSLETLNQQLVIATYAAMLTLGMLAVLIVPGLYLMHEHRKG